MVWKVLNNVKVYFKFKFACGDWCRGFKPSRYNAIEKTFPARDILPTLSLRVEKTFNKFYSRAVAT